MPVDKSVRVTGMVSLLVQPLEYAVIGRRPVRFLTHRLRKYRSIGRRWNTLEF